MSFSSWTNPSITKDTVSFLGGANVTIYVYHFCYTVFMFFRFSYFLFFLANLLLSLVSPTFVVLRNIHSRNARKIERMFLVAFYFGFNCCDDVSVSIIEMS